MRPALLLVALLLIPGVGAQAARATAVVDWTYTISIPPGTEGIVRVEIRIDGGKDLIATMSFAADALNDRVTNVSGAPATPLTWKDETFTFDVNGPERFQYDILVEEVAFGRQDERLAHVGPDFAVFKAESLQLAHSYSYFQGKTWTNRTTVHLEAPGGWQAAGPWPRAETGAYSLVGEDIQPRGYVAMGAFLEDTTFTAAGRSFRHVRLGEAGPYAAGFQSYLENATPYYTRMYGNVTGGTLLLVNAPAPMFRGGLGGTDSLFLHETVDTRTLGHEYAHVFQRYASNEKAPGSTLWVHEGDADRQSVLSLYAARSWSAGDVDRFFEEAIAEGRNAEFRGAIVTNASYGNSLERFAYQKGAVLMHALDAAMREATSGRVGVDDLMRRLNADHGTRGSPAYATPITNAEVRRLVDTLTGADLGAFFDAYVDGPAWPTITRFTPTSKLLVENITLTPPRALPGGSVVIAARIANVGTSAANERLDVRLGDARADTIVVDLQVGGVATYEVTVIAPEPGRYNVSVLDGFSTFDSLRPARLRMSELRFISTPREGEVSPLSVTIVNDGEVAGSGTLTGTSGGALLDTQNLTVEGGASANVTLRLAFPSTGDWNLTLHLETPRGNQTHHRSVNVLPARLPPPAVTSPTRAAVTPGVAPGATRDDAGAEAANVPTSPAMLLLATLAMAALRKGAARRR